MVKMNKGDGSIYLQEVCSSDDGEKEAMRG
jgi:hypothetical protein